jgi:DNA ligase-1
VKRFATLFSEIDATTRTSEKVDAMVRYFADVPPHDAAWAVYFLSGNRPKRLLPARKLAGWAMQEAQVPEWLFDESYEAVGDLAETITLLLPDAERDDDRPLHAWVEETLLTLPTLPEALQREVMHGAWRTLRGTQRFVWNKFITGGWRVGVSRQLVTRALAQVSGVDEGTIAHRLTGTWTPSAEAFTALVATDTRDADRSRPYPFYLAYALEGEVEALGESADWQVEWKWDGIRSQLVRRDGTTHIWSRGEELLTERFPELVRAAEFLPDNVVLDGEILPWKDGAPLPFAQLQRRIGRVKLGPKILADVPVVIVVYDLLEQGGRDLRNEPLSRRRALLEELLTSARAEERLIPSPLVPSSSWPAVQAAYARARDMSAEGLMLKRRDGVYGVGRRKGGWWKWKVQPYSLDAVMVYAQAGSGRRASLNTDMTFALWDNGTLVPFAKAYSGLTDAELRELDAWIRRNTLEKFGPVRRVEPMHVFEIAFEAIQRSPRHKAGVAVRFPRILRWRTDKKAEDADNLDALRRLLIASDAQRR